MLLLLVGESFPCVLFLPIVILNLFQDLVAHRLSPLKYFINGALYGSRFPSEMTKMGSAKKGELPGDQFSGLEWKSGNVWSVQRSALQT